MLEFYNNDYFLKSGRKLKRKELSVKRSWFSLFKGLTPETSSLQRDSLYMALLDICQPLFFIVILFPPKSTKEIKMYNTRIDCAKILEISK